jgi:hypothetical protein
MVEREKDKRERGGVRRKKRERKGEEREKGR